MWLMILRMLRCCCIRNIKKVASLVWSAPCQVDSQKNKNFMMPTLRKSWHRFFMPLYGSDIVCTLWESYSWGVFDNDDYCSTLCIHWPQLPAHRMNWTFWDNTSLILAFPRMLPWDRCLCILILWTCFVSFRHQQAFYERLYLYNRLKKRDYSLSLV